MGALVAAMLRVGIIGFGGGAALIPVMDDELVRRRGLLTPKQFGAHTLIANLTPGALPVKLAALAGAELGRPVEAILAAGAVALPGTMASVGLLAGFTAIGPGGIRLVEFAAVGISAFIIVLLGHFVGKVLRAAGDRRGLVLTVVILSFLVTGGAALIRLLGGLLGYQWQVTLPRLSAVQLVFLAILVIALGHLARPQRGSARSGSWVHTPWHVAGLFLLGLAAAIGAALLWPGGAHFLGLVGLSSATSFGGGEAYVAVADGFFVTNQVVNGAEFYGQAVPIANALPGPILVKIASTLGFSFGMSSGGWPLGLAFAAGAFVVSVAASAIPAMVLMAGHAKLAGSVFMRRLGAYILPVICGLLLTTSVSMVEASMDIAARAQVSAPAVGWATLGAIGVLWWAQTRRQLPGLVLLVSAGLCSTVLLLFVAS